MSIFGYFSLLVNRYNIDFQGHSFFKLAYVKGILLIPSFIQYRLFDSIANDFYFVNFQEQGILPQLCEETNTPYSLVRVNKNSQQ